MAGLAQTLAEAEAALATLVEIVDQAERSLVERDGASLRLIYTFEAVWKATQALLGEREIAVGRDRNLGVHMYRGEIGTEIGAKLVAHAALLRRWLAALQQASSALVR